MDRFQRLGQLTSEIVLSFSVASSLLLLIICARRLKQRTFRSNAAVIQVVLIASIDLCQGLLGFVPVFTGEQPVSYGVKYCPVFMKVRCWLLLASALMSAAMVLGVLLAVLGMHRLPQWQRYSPAAAIALTFVLQPNFFSRATYWQDSTGCDYPNTVGCCTSNDRSDEYFSMELAAVLLFISSVQVYLLFRIKRTVPGSIVSRCLLSASGYIAACFCSYFPLLATRLADLAVRKGSLGHSSEDQADWNFAHSISWKFALCNGFFNMLAMMYHGRKLLFRAQSANDLLLPSRSVRISPKPQTVLIDPVSPKEVVAHICEQAAGCNQPDEDWNQPGWPHDASGPSRDDPSGGADMAAQVWRDIGFVDESMLQDLISRLNCDSESSGTVVTLDGA